MREIPIDYLREALSYDPDTGALTWNARPRTHFRTTNAWSVCNARFAGRKAGNFSADGYLRLGLRFDGGFRYLLAHRVAWALVTEAWPLNIVDHINGNPLDNRLENLRVGTHTDNLHNQRLRKTNTSGYMGVSLHEPTGRYRATISARGRFYSLGYFPTPELAYAAYLEAKRELHPFQPVPREGVVRQETVEFRASEPSAS